MNYFFEDGTGNIADEHGEEATTILEEKSFHLKSLTDLNKYIKSKYVQLEVNNDETVMKKDFPKKERALEYNIYTIEDRTRYFYFLKEKFMELKEAAVAANVNYDTAENGKWPKEKTRSEEFPSKRLICIRKYLAPAR